LSMEQSASVYPSFQELCPAIMETRLPARLISEMAMRYESLGDKYLTEQLHTDGRRINAMMFTSRVGNCIEEVVDSVFCVLGWIFKAKRLGKPIPPSAYPCLDMLTQVYSLLSAEFELEQSKPNHERIDL
jgi:hypothetical protein